MQGVVLVLVVIVILDQSGGRRAQRTARSTGSRSMTAVTDIKAPSPALARCQAILRWMRHDVRAVLSITFLALLVIVSIFAPVLAPYSPIEQDVTQLLLPPSAAHWLGTDDLGRDVLSRLIWGAPNSLYASFLAVGVGIALGVPIGLVIGFLGGWIDEVDEPLHRRAAVVSADRAGDRGHRRARHRPHQRHAVGRLRVRAGAGAAGARPDPGGQEARSMSMRRVALAPAPATSSSDTSCRTRSSR